MCQRTDDAGQLDAGQLIVESNDEFQNIED